MISSRPQKENLKDFCRNKAHTFQGKEASCLVAGADENSRVQRFWAVGTKYYECRCNKGEGRIFIL